MTDTAFLELIQSALDDIAPDREADGELTLDRTIEDLGLDSVATMELVGFIEEEADMTFPDEALPDVSTLGDLLTLVRAEAG